MSAMGALDRMAAETQHYRPKRGHGPGNAASASYFASADSMRHQQTRDLLAEAFQLRPKGLDASKARAAKCSEFDALGNKFIK
ncbi:hypothetical protein [Novosphingobium sp. PhB165]|uniref:hypothetical protein n=1 Tax=Novosphingobium sp. PhB165 TaxID=2485105 RepID=UPI001051B4F8|nr:hypothetical protein [Novosphingobium sp. PhB165]